MEKRVDKRHPKSEHIGTLPGNYREQGASCLQGRVAYGEIRDQRSFIFFLEASECLRDTAHQGGPWLMRFRTLFSPSGEFHMLSIHQVTPASSNGPIIEAAWSGLSPGVSPSQMMSKGVVAV